MHKPAAWIMAFVFLFSSTELHEFVHLPRLVIHFMQHRQQNTSLGLAGFLQLHYRYDHPADNDEKDDQQLPFKSGTTLLKTESTTTIFPSLLPEKIVSPVKRLYSHLREDIPLHHPARIFHPPRILLL